MLATEQMNVLQSLLYLDLIVPVTKAVFVLSLLSLFILGCQALSNHI